jgi:hypothetical protein
MIPLSEDQATFVRQSTIFLFLCVADLLAKWQKCTRHYFPKMLSLKKILCKNPSALPPSLPTTEVKKFVLRNDFFLSLLLS